MEKVLEVLQENARLSTAEIARRLGRTEEEVAAQVEKLEKEKYILGYRAVVNPEKCEDDTVMAIIEVRLTPQRDTGFDAIAQRIAKFPEVRNCYLMSGAYDLHIIVEGKSLREVAGFVSEKLAPQEQVSGTATHFILKKYKDYGVKTHETEQMDRLAVSP